MGQRKPPGPYKGNDPALAGRSFRVMVSAPVMRDCFGTVIQERMVTVFDNSTGERLGMPITLNDPGLAYHSLASLIKDALRFGEYFARMPDITIPPPAQPPEV